MHYIIRNAMLHHSSIAITLNTAPVNSQCLLPPLSLKTARNTYQATRSHPFSVQFLNAKINRYSQSYMYTIGQIWNTLPASIFLSSYDLFSFKGNLSKHIECTRDWTWLYTFFLHLSLHEWRHGADFLAVSSRLIYIKTEIHSVFLLTILSHSFYRPSSILVYFFFRVLSLPLFLSTLDLLL